MVRRVRSKSPSAVRGARPEPSLPQEPLQRRWRQERQPEEQQLPAAAAAPSRRLNRSRSPRARGAQADDAPAAASDDKHELKAAGTKGEKKEGSVDAQEEEEDEEEEWSRIPVPLRAAPRPLPEKCVTGSSAAAVASEAPSLPSSRLSIDVESLNRPSRDGPSLDSSSPKTSSPLGLVAQVGFVAESFRLMLSPGEMQAQPLPRFPFASSVDGGLDGGVFVGASAGAPAVAAQLQPQGSSPSSWPSPSLPASPAAPADKPHPSLWTIELMEQLTALLQTVVGSLARYWLDERGNSPFGRFLRPDSESLLPTRRVAITIILGLLLSYVGLLLTEDRYAQGAPFPGEEERLLNASDFPVHISFRKVGCSVKGRPEPVLDGVTGQVRPGRLTAILGRSGSGKTTLANLILGRSRTFCQQQFGTVYMNGRPRSLELILDRIGFVPQDDVMYRELTVRETLSLSAESRLQRFASSEYKRAVVESTLALLGLAHHADQRIGEGLSGGEIKRVSIGMEVVTQPSVLIMDEPTSGLDSSAASQIMRTLRDQADKGVAVVTVLHQPTTRVYDLIDDLILLQSGRPVYVGPRIGVLDYFARMGFEIPSFLPVARDGDEDEGFLETSPPELLVDILAGVATVRNESVCSLRLAALRVGANATSAELLSQHARCLHDLWLRFGDSDREWREIEVGMDTLRRQERRTTLRLLGLGGDAGASAGASSGTGSSSTGTGSHLGEEGLIEESGLETCDANYPGIFRYWCYALWGVSWRGSSKDSLYPVRARPGMFQQVYLWVLVLFKIDSRRKPLIEVLIVLLLAATVAFVRSYNMTWNRRGVGGFFLSISVSLVGMFGALFNDDIGPVRRAAESGMVLGAYQIALNLYTLAKGFALMNIYALAYFSTLYLRRGVFCQSPFSMWTFMEFIHMMHMLYMCAHSLGLVVCVAVDHRLYDAYEVSLALFICQHTFAFFAPNKTQVKEDALVLGKINTEPLINFICSLSYVRYFLEAVLLWEPVDGDTVGRNTALRYFGYVPEHKPMCITCLFAVWSFNYAVHFIMFSRFNRNVFNALHDTPLFFIFAAKVALAFLLALVVMTGLHELPRLRDAFHKGISRYKTQRKLLRSPRTSSSGGSAEPTVELLHMPPINAIGGHGRSDSG